MTSSAKSSVVIDSNVWVSAIVFGGVPSAVFRKILHDRITLVVSDEILTEVRRVLHEKFPKAAKELGVLLTILRDDLVAVKLGAITLNVSRDADDNRMLETAVLGGAATIISGDNDLLVLGNYDGIAIIKPSEWLERIRKTS